VPFDALSVTQLKEGGTSTDSNAYVPTSFTATSGALVLICLAHGRDAGTPSQATSIVGASISGASMRASQTFDVVATPRHRVSIWSALGTGAASTLTITFPETQNSCRWWIGEVVNADTSRGTHGVTAVNVGNGDAGTAVVVNFFGSSVVAMADAGCRVVAAASSDQASGATPKSGWVEHIDAATTTPVTQLFVESKFDVQDNEPQATLAGTGDWGMAAVGIAATGTADPAPRRVIMSTAAVDRASRW
jgi:hypothetical protein